MHPDSTEWIGKGDFVYRSENPPVFHKAEGPYLYDTQGNRYIDAESANGTASLGYDASLLQEALQTVSQLPSLPSFCESELRLETAQRIGQFIEKETGIKGRVMFETGGAQGIELAVKIARLNTGSSQILAFEGAYHGRSGLASQLSASHRYRKLLGDWRLPVTRLPLPDSSRSTLKESEWQAMYHERIESLFHDERCGVALQEGKQDIAACIYEPILNVAGMAMPDSSVLRHIAEETRKAGGLVIADEVFCGMYRTGKFLGSQLHGITPDILVLSKGLTNGIAPLSCVWAREPLLQPTNVPPGTHSTTYMNNIHSLTVASAVLDRHDQWTTREDDIHLLQESLAMSIKHICQSSDKAHTGYAIGGLGRIVLKNALASDIRAKAMQNGLMLAATGMAPDVINIHPPLTMTHNQIQECTHLLEKTFT